MKSLILLKLLNSLLRAPADEGGAGGQGGAGDGGEGAGAGGQGGAGDGGEGAGAGGQGGAGAAPDFKWFGEEPDKDTKDYLTAKAFDSPAKIYKSLRAAEGALRGDRIPGPPEDPAKFGDWMKESGLAKRLGIPETADKYGIEKPKFAEEAAPFISFDDDRHGRFLGKAHELNLLPAQVKGVLDFYAAEMGGDVKAFTDAAIADETESQTTLKREWGDQFEQNQRAALEVAKEVGLTVEQIESLRVAKVAGSTVMTKILHELAQARGNDPLKGGGGAGGGGDADPAAALTTFMAENATALNKGDDPKHDWAMGELERLKKLAGRGSVSKGA